MKKSDVNGLPIHYEVIGEGRPVLCIHGFSLDHHMMSGCLEPIFEQLSGWKRIYLDLPGMGKTPGPDWIQNTDDMLDLVLAFVEKIIPNQSFTIAGESYGGYLAQGIVHKKPALVDGMMLLCPLTEADFSKRDNPPKNVLVQDLPFLEGLPSDEREEFQSFAVVQTKETWERTDSEVNVGIRAHDKDFLERIYSQENYKFSFNLYPLPQQMNKPTLILLGRQDHIVGYEDTMKHLESYPRASLAVLDRAGHNLQIEQPTLFNTLVHEWLDRIKESMA